MIGAKEPQEYLVWIICLRPSFGPKVRKYAGKSDEKSEKKMIVQKTAVGPMGKMATSDPVENDKMLKFAENQRSAMDHHLFSMRL